MLVLSRIKRPKRRCDPLFPEERLSFGSSENYQKFKLLPSCEISGSHGSEYEV
jgi:hypothetical protein